MYPQDYLQTSPFDPLMLLGLLAALMLCMICACCAFVSGTGIGYYLRTTKTTTKKANRRPIYQQVDVEESEQQV